MTQGWVDFLNMEENISILPSVPPSLQLKKQTKKNKKTKKTEGRKDRR